METTPLIIEQSYHAPITQVWQAITDPNQMKEWYFDIQEFKAEEGFTFQFTAGSEEVAYRHECKVLTCAAPSILSYSWRYPDYQGSSLVTWELTAEDEVRTHLRLTHSGLETFPQDNPDFGRDSFTEGWNYFIKESLTAFLDTETIEKETTINVPADIIWDIVLSAANQWALAFGEGTRVKTDWMVGSEVVWLDGEDQVCAYGIVAEHRPGAYLQVDMYDELAPGPDAEPGAYSETYALTPVEDGQHRLRITSGPLPKGEIAEHSPLWDKVVEIIKEMAEIK